jgi:Ca2+-binding RTX toxin-like protein
LIDAGEGNDTIFAGAGDDTLIGGKGDDHIYVSNGIDTLYFSKGDGQDTVVLNNYDNNNNDRIVFNDVSSTDLIGLEDVNGDLIVKYSETDTIIIKGFFNTDSAFAGGFAFSDQIQWSRQDILAKALIRGTEGSDQIWGFNGGFNNIVAGAGDDLIYVGNSGSRVNAGDGNDTIYDGMGNDILIGGTGDDFINLSYGQDIFFASKGDGHDTLVLNYRDDNPNDRIVFTDIASTDEITVELINEQLIVKYGAADSITIKGFFSSDLAFSGGIEFSDQVKWSRQDILGKISIQGTPGDDQLWGFNGGFNNIFAGDGNDTIHVGNGGSRVEAGAGNDTIYDGVGNDILIGGQGDDFINLSFGQDIFMASKGDGHDTIKTSYYDDNVFDKIVFNDVLDSDIQSLLNIDSSLVIQYGDGDQITVKDFFSSDTILSGGLVFSDQSAWSRQDVLEKAVTQGTSGDDYIWGYNQAKNTIYAGAGNDTIMAGSHGSAIFAQGGDDVIYGGAGNDLIIGGTGNDAMHGNSGADTYSFQLGDGQDTIFLDNWDYDHNDSIIFSGLTSSQATFEKNDADLLIKYGTNDQVLIKNAFSSEDTLLGGVKFDDVVMTKADISSSINMYQAPELTILGQPPTHTDYL